MSRAARLWVFLFLIAGTAGSSAAFREPRQNPPIRVLFIGNSYTYFNNLPCLVTELAIAGGRKIQAEMIVEGGATLGDLWQKPETQAALRNRWDAIVLQTQSEFGKLFLVNGLSRMSDTSSLLADSRSYVDAARKAGATVFLYEHWRRRDAPERDQSVIHSAFAQAGRSLGVKTIPVGLVFELAQRHIRSADLYHTDGSHPSPLGSYAAALAILQALTGDRLAAPPRSLRCPEIDENTEKPTAAFKMLTVDASAAAHLTTAVVDAAKTWPEASTRAVPPIELPQVPRNGEEIGDLTGEWTGETRLYPRGLPWPARLTLRVRKDLSADLVVSFGGTPDDIVRTVRLTTSGREARFEDPQGPSKTVVKYRGARQGNQLRGIAELTGNPNLYGIGEWVLTRSPAK